MVGFFIELMERGLVPDWVIRLGIRKLCGDRLRELAPVWEHEPSQQLKSYAQKLQVAKIAVKTTEANQQHYEVPTEFYLSVLGSNRKYSCTYFESTETSLDQAELTALNITVERAEIHDGMEILELGCGWGSLSLHMARKFPNARILAVSNSKTQRAFIERQAQSEGLTNLRIATLDLANEVSETLIPAGHFDRVVSVEMFEHFQNYKILFQRISRWLKADGKLFVHIFTHQKYSYPFETEGADNWMGQYFFTGGQMPSKNLFTQFQTDLRLENQWEWQGTHYQKTAEAWLQNLDQSRKQILAIFTESYGPQQAKRWLIRWRVFFLACSELFGYRGGTEWGVTHYLFSQKS